jgi:hypothetical protein
MRTLAACIPVLLLAAALASAADISGKWKGTLEFQDPAAPADTGTAYAELKQDAGAVTGTAGPEEYDQYTIEKGKVEGTTVTFEYSSITGAPSVYKLKLTLVSEDRMEGEMVVESAAGSTYTGKVVLSRIKSSAPA